MRALLTAAVLAGGSAGVGCMRDTIMGGVGAAGAGGWSGSAGSGAVAGATPTAGAGAAAPIAGQGGAGVGAGSAGAGGTLTPMAGSAAGSQAGASGAAGEVGGAAGVGGSAGTAAGSGGSTAGVGGGQAAAAKPVERDGKYVLEFGGLAFEIDPKVGGRILKCQIDGQNFLTGPDVDPLNYGSTFWPSPQQRWNWPPVPEIDSHAYTAVVEGDTLVLTSPVGERAKVEVTKRFTARVSEGALDVEYELTNRDTAAASWAPWEITRVPAKGLTFFPTGAKTVNTQLPVRTMGDTTWYQHDPATVGMGQKYSADGTGGWLAHVAGDKLLLKSFPDIEPAMQAPAPEAEIAIYAAPGYVELEPQGPYGALMPGASVRWTVRWYLRKLPADLMVSVGSAPLLSFAQTIAAESAER